MESVLKVARVLLVIAMCLIIFNKLMVLTPVVIAGYHAVSGTTVSPLSALYQLVLLMMTPWMSRSYDYLVGQLKTTSLWRWLTASSTSDDRTPR